MLFDMYNDYISNFVELQIRKNNNETQVEWY